MSAQTVGELLGAAADRWPDALGLIEPESCGLDHEPVSVHEKMRAMGLVQVPSTASMARMFREAGVACRKPKK